MDAAWQEELRQVWQEVEASLQRLIYNLDVKESTHGSAGPTFDLYNKIAKLTRYNLPPRAYKQQLYERCVALINQYQSEQVLPALAGLQGEPLLRELQRRWSDHGQVVERLAYFLKPHDLCIGAWDFKPKLEDVGKASFRERVFAVVHARARDTVLAAIQRERAGGAADDRAMLKGALGVFAGMGAEAYERDIEAFLLEEASQHCRRQAGVWAQEEDSSGYAHKAQEALRAEGERADAFLPAASKPKLLAAVEAELQVARFSTPALGQADSGLSPGWQVFLKHRSRHLASDLSLAEDHLCGPSFVLRRYLRLAAACKELRWLVLGHALPALAQRMPGHVIAPLSTPGLLPLLQRLSSDPQSLTLPELQAAASLCGVDATGTAAQLTLRLLDQRLGVRWPTLAPLELLLAIKYEKERPPGSDLELVASTGYRLPHASNPPISCVLVDGEATLFTACAYAERVFGVADARGWEQLAARCRAAEAERCEAARIELERQRVEQEAQQAALAARRLAERREALAAAAAGPRNGRKCVCGPSAFSPACAHRLCKRCCERLGSQVYCQRHKTGPQPGA